MTHPPSKFAAPPKPVREPSRGLQQFFRSNFNRWSDFYDKQNFFARVYQERQATALRFAESLRLLPGATVLDAGCGPGVTSVALAEKGYRVHALDFVEELAASTKARGRKAGVDAYLRATVGDATRLPFADQSFDLVVMLGVTEWVPRLESLVSEAARVIKPGGHLIIAWNNRWGLHMILDPAANPIFKPLRSFMRRAIEKHGWNAPPRGYYYSLRNFKKCFDRYGLVNQQARGIGFGPFSLLSWRFVPEALGHKLNSVLQRLADRRMRRLQAVARNHVALARKSGTATARARGKQQRQRILKSLSMSPRPAVWKIISGSDGTGR